MTDQIEMAEPHGQPVIKLQTPEGAVALISLFGAQLLSWTPGRRRRPPLLSPKAIFDGATAIRGGVPVCFPQFAGRRPPAQARLRPQPPLEVGSTRAGKDFAVTTLRLADDADTAPCGPTPLPPR
jgi:glucose-6-phosphate 1-epimerase